MLGPPDQCDVCVSIETGDRGQEPVLSLTGTAEEKPRANVL